MRSQIYFATGCLGLAAMLGACADCEPYVEEQREVQTVTYVEPPAPEPVVVVERPVVVEQVRCPSVIDNSTITGFGSSNGATWSNGVWTQPPAPTYVADYGTQGTPVTVVRRRTTSFGGDEPRPTTTTVMPICSSSVKSAIAVIRSTEGNTCKGTVRFTQTDHGVRVQADLEGLKPNQKHGFHVHEFGDLSASDGTSAGGHFNPSGVEHGGPNASKHHAGDLGNLESDADGRAHLDVVLEGMSIASDQNAVLGRSVVVHEKGDDLTSQPAGDSGKRIGCGVIGVGSETK